MNFQIFLRNNESNRKLLLVAKENKTDQIISLLDLRNDKKINVNYKDNLNNNTPLHYACVNGNLKIV